MNEKPLKVGDIDTSNYDQIYHPTYNQLQLVFKLTSDNKWHCVSSPHLSEILLSDYLEKLNIEIPENTQFLRIKNAAYTFEYRAYTGSTVRLNLYY